MTIKWAICVSPLLIPLYVCMAFFSLLRKITEEWILSLCKYTKLWKTSLKYSKEYVANLLNAEGVRDHWRKGKISAQIVWKSSVLLSLCEEGTGRLGPRRERIGALDCPPWVAVGPVFFKIEKLMFLLDEFSGLFRITHF